MAVPFALPDRRNRYDVHMVDGRPQRYSATMLLAAEAIRQGLRFEQTSSRLLSIMAPGEPALHFRWSRVKDLSREGFLIALDKDATARHLHSHGLPATVGVAVDADAPPRLLRRAVRQVGFPLVVKPLRGRQGIDVWPGLRRRKQFNDAWEHVRSGRFASSGIRIERHVDGVDLRILATADDGLSAIWRRPASVIGDARHTVEQLASHQNRERRHNPYIARKLIKLGPGAQALLAQQRLTLDAVPDEGRVVKLSETANLSQGGESVEVTASTHPSILQLAARVVRSIPGMPYAGVDVLVQDPSVPLARQQVVVLEVNATPDVLMHPFPVYGEPANIRTELLMAAARFYGADLDLTPNTTESSRRVELAIKGLHDTSALVGWLGSRLKLLDLHGDLTRNGSSAIVNVQGPPERIAMLTRRLTRARGFSVERVAARPL